MAPHRLLLVAALVTASATAPAAQMAEPARPQDDLYRAVNASWLATAEIPPDVPYLTTFIELHLQAEADVRAVLDDAVAAVQAGEAVPGSPSQQIGALYLSLADSAAIARAGLDPLAADLARIDAVRSPADLARYLGASHGQFGAAALSASVAQDLRRPTRHVVYLMQGGTSLPDPSYYTDADKAPLREAYTAALAELLRLAGADEPRSQADAAVRVEAALAAHQRTPTELRDIEAAYNPRAVADLARATDGFDVRAYLAAAGLAAVDTVVVAQPEFVDGLAAAVRTLPTADWRAYLRASLLAEAAPVLPDAYGDALFAFSQALTGQAEQRGRAKRAADAVGAMLGETVGEVFLDRHFPDASRARMAEMIENLRAALRISITGADWMTEPTRAAALAKLDAARFKIGGPEAPERVEAEFRSGDAAGNLRRFAAWRRADELAKLVELVDPAEWQMTPQTVNAYHDPARNEVVFPAAILRPPFFDPTADDATNYGAIGAIIGHEFSHGFDDQGRRFDAGGTLRDWWTPADAAAYEARVAPIVAQYERYRPIPGDSAHVNGTLTLGENISDLAGLAIAHRAYRLSLGGADAPVLDGLTGDQRFFMSWGRAWRSKAPEPFVRYLLGADTHSPGEFRANGPVGHLQAFVDAFSVRPGDALWIAPADRIAVW